MCSDCAHRGSAGPDHTSTAYKNRKSRCVGLLKFSIGRTDACQVRARVRDHRLTISARLATIASWVGLYSITPVAI